MLDKKQIWVIFLFEFKMGHKAVETTPNINNTFGPGTGNKRTMPWWFQTFYKGDKSLEDEECNGQPLEVVWQLRVIIKANPVTTTLRLPKNSTSITVQQFGIWSKLERWKSLISRCPMSWPKILKNQHFEESSSVILSTKMNHFLIGLWHAMKSRFYTTASDDQFSA